MQSDKHRFIKTINLRAFLFQLFCVKIISHETTTLVLERKRKSCQTQQNVTQIAQIFSASVSLEYLFNFFFMRTVKRSIRSFPRIGLNFLLHENTLYANAVKDKC